jgi:hypothetical protein
MNVAQPDFLLDAVHEADQKFVDAGWRVATEALFKMCRSHLESVNSPFKFCEISAYVQKVMSENPRHANAYSPTFYAVRVMPALENLSKKDRRIAKSLKQAFENYEASLAYCFTPTTAERPQTLLYSARTVSGFESPTAGATVYRR